MPIFPLNHHLIPNPTFRHRISYRSSVHPLPPPPTTTTTVEEKSICTYVTQLPQFKCKLYGFIEWWFFSVERINRISFLFYALWIVTSISIIVFCPSSSTFHFEFVSYCFFSYRALTLYVMHFVIDNHIHIDIQQQQEMHINHKWRSSSNHCYYYYYYVDVGVWWMVMHLSTETQFYS